MTQLVTDRDKDKEETMQYYRKNLYQLSVKSLGQIPELDELSDEQGQWTDRKMSCPLICWERWDGIIEEWMPWNGFGEWVNVWRHYKKK
jgi:hypothetical protein